MEDYSAFNKKGSTDKCCNLDEPGKYYAVWKKPDTTGHTVAYDSIVMKCTEQADL